MPGRQRGVLGPSPAVAWVGEDICSLAASFHQDQDEVSATLQEPQNQRVTKRDSGSGIPSWGFPNGRAAQLSLFHRSERRAQSWWTSISPTGPPARLCVCEAQRLPLPQWTLRGQRPLAKQQQAECSHQRAPRTAMASKTGSTQLPPEVGPFPRHPPRHPLGGWSSAFSRPPVQGGELERGKYPVPSPPQYSRGRPRAG